MLKIDQVPGSGVLQFMHPGMTLSVHDAAALMIVLSDNTATNLLLDRIIIRRVWDKMEALGLPHTKVHSKTFLRISSVAMDSSVKYGLGVSTPNEMAHLFELLARGKGGEPAADSAMLDILANNADGELMQRTIDGVARPAQNRRDRLGSDRVRAVPLPVARRRVRVHEAEHGHPLGGRQRGAGRAGEDRRRCRGGLAASEEETEQSQRHPTGTVVDALASRLAHRMPLPPSRGGAHMSYRRLLGSRCIAGHRHRGVGAVHDVHSAADQGADSVKAAVAAQQKAQADSISRHAAHEHEDVGRLGGGIIAPPVDGARIRHGSSPAH